MTPKKCWAYTEGTSWSITIDFLADTKQKLRSFADFFLKTNGHNLNTDLYGSLWWPRTRSNQTGLLIDNSWFRWNTNKCSLCTAYNLYFRSNIQCSMLHICLFPGKVIPMYINGIFLMILYNNPLFQCFLTVFEYCYDCEMSLMEGLKVD